MSSDENVLSKLDASFELCLLPTNLKTLKALNLNSSECNSEKISKVDV